MIRTGLRSALVAGPSRRAVSAPIATLRAGSSARPITSSIPFLRRGDDRLPSGHVRPARRVPERPIPISAWDTPPAQTLEQALPSIASRHVYVPPDPQGALSENHAAYEILAHDTLVVVRQLEMLNVFMGYEQANRYAIYTPEGDLVGYLAEEEQTILSALSRQALRTHRPFRATIMDRTGQPILWIRRPFAFINSRIFVHANEGKEGKLVGEAQQEWHPWRRRYNVFQSRDEETMRQFARIDSGFLAWDFWLKDKDDRLVASINRNFRGLGRELFTDTGQYVIRFDSAGTELDMPTGSDVSLQGQTLILPDAKDRALTLDQRAMALATAVSIDFDYFSRHSGSGGFGFPFFMWGGGDGSSDVHHGRGDSQGDMPGGAAGAGAAGAGAAGAMGAAPGPSEDELIYGPQPGRQGGDTGRTPTEAYPGEAEWMEQPEEAQWGQEDVMEDPWGQGDSDDGGWFGGGGGGGGGGDWGDWGS